MVGRSLSWRPAISPSRSASRKALRTSPSSSRQRNEPPTSAPWRRARGRRRAAAAPSGPGAASASSSTKPTPVVKNSGSTIASAPSAAARSASRSHASRLASISATRASSWTAAIRIGPSLFPVETLLQLSEALPDLGLALARLVLEGGDGRSQAVARLGHPSQFGVEPRPQQQRLRRVDIVPAGENRGDPGLGIDVVQAAGTRLAEVLGGRPPALGELVSGPIADPNLEGAGRADVLYQGIPPPGPPPLQPPVDEARLRTPPPLTPPRPPP